MKKKNIFIDLYNKPNLQLNVEQIDYLMELGNIGSGNAIVALSKLLNQKVEVSLTSVEIIPFWNLSKKLGGDNIEVFGIISNVKDEPNLSLLYIFTKESVINMINLLSGKKQKKLNDLHIIENLDEFSFSIVSEIGNILTGHYTSALGNLLSITLIPDVPHIAYDSLGAIVECITAKCADIADFLMIINTKLRIRGLDLKGSFCFIPSIKHIDKILKGLNILFEI